VGLTSLLDAGASALRPAGSGLEAPHPLVVKGLSVGYMKKATLFQVA